MGNGAAGEEGPFLPEMDVKCPKIQSCMELDRMVFEEYLTYIYQYPHLDGIVLNRDIPPTPSADETRAVRNMLSEMILENLDGWGEEYEQIRQDDSLE